MLMEKNADLGLKQHLYESYSYFSFLEKCDIFIIKGEIKENENC